MLEQSLTPLRQAEIFRLWKGRRLSSKKAKEVVCLCDFWSSGRDAVESQVEAVRHVLVIAKVDQETDVDQVVVGAGLHTTYKKNFESEIDPRGTARVCFGGQA